MHYELTAILPDGVVTETITLGPDDTADHPASTKRDLYGPATVTYRRYPDGGISATIRDIAQGEILPETLAVDSGRE